MQFVNDIYLYVSDKVWYICNSMKCKIDYMQLIVYIVESYKYIICKNNSKE